MMKKTLFNILILAILLFVGGCGGNLDKEKSSKKVITWNEIEKAYKGSFLVPDGSFGVKEQNFHYSKGAFCIKDKETIFLQGHSYSKEVRELKLPKTFNNKEAKPIGKWFDPTDNLQSTGDILNEYYRLGDMLILKNRIYFTKYSWYNFEHDYDSFGYREKSSTFADGKSYGLWNADHKLAHNMRIGGYLSNAPKSLKLDGVTFLAGQQGLSGDAMGRWGPNLFAVKFDANKKKGEAMEAIPLIVHPNKEKKAQDWNIANRVYSITWIETKNRSGVLVMFTKVYGDMWYGEADENNPPDPYGGEKGYHSTGKQLIAWIYNPDDLLKVYNKKLKPHEVKPIEKKVLIDLKPGKVKGEEEHFSIFRKIRAIRMKMLDNRLIMIQSSTSDLPKGFVFDFD